LIERCWGNYVAFLSDKTGCRIIRGPFGTLPCYYRRCASGWAIGSDMAIFEEAGLPRPDVDWDAVTRHIIAPNLRAASTCLAGVTELPGGSRLKLAPTVGTTDPLWSPWSFASAARRMHDAGEAVLAVRATVHAAIHALAGSHRRAVLGISGGLDSSIVAACLAQEDIGLSCLSLFTRDAAGDERDYARALASHLGVPLIEAREEVSQINLSRSDAAHLPRPLARSFAQSGDRQNQLLAAQAGADVYFSGGGGDNVFCSLQSAAPVADRLLTTGIDAKAWRTAADMSRIADTGTWKVLLKGFERAWWRTPAYRWRAETEFVSDQAASMVAMACQHPWSECPPGALPGSATHIAYLTGILNHVEGYARERDLPMRWPLLAQPLVELCLQIPSWMWCSGGHNRSIARRAFADILPEKILLRRSKGSPDPFVIEIFEAHRSYIRELLTEGLLAGAGIIDTARVAATLTDSAPVRGVNYWRIMTLLDVEAWARGWTPSGRS
jgi:asparagine synthase (glutamine-hydrolysing)